MSWQSRFKIILDKVRSDEKITFPMRTRSDEVIVVYTATNRNVGTQIDNVLYVATRPLENGEVYKHLPEDVFGNNVLMEIYNLPSHHHITGDKAIQLTKEYLEAHEKVIGINLDNFLSNEDVERLRAYASAFAKLNFDGGMAVLYKFFLKVFDDLK